MIIDTHCHYNVEPILADAKKHWQNSLDNDVVGAVCVGTDINNSKTALDLSQQFEGMFASIAIHPEKYTNYIKSLSPEDIYPKNIKKTEQLINKKIVQDIAEFENLLNQANDTQVKSHKTQLETNNSKTQTTNSQTQNRNKLIAIGEIGLDYYRLKSKGIKRDLAINMQKKIFSKQLTLAFKHELPVILHVRDQADRNKITQKITSNAYYDTFKIVNQAIQKFKNNNENKNNNIPSIILHCASGPTDYIKNFLDIGAYIGFGGNVTYDNAPELREIFKLTPKNRVLLETDAPYLAPGEKKGQICEPYFITTTAEFLQNNYNLDLDIIITNTLKVFPQFKKIINNTQST